MMKSLIQIVSEIRKGLQKIVLICVSLIICIFVIIYLSLNYSKLYYDFNALENETQILRNEIDATNKKNKSLYSEALRLREEKQRDSLELLVTTKNKQKFKEELGYVKTQLSSAEEDIKGLDKENKALVQQVDQWQDKFNNSRRSDLASKRENRELRGENEFLVKENDLTKSNQEELLCEIEGQQELYNKETLARKRAEDLLETKVGNKANLSSLADSFLGVLLGILLTLLVMKMNKQGGVSPVYLKIRKVVDRAASILF